jgi:repressor LexA
MHNILTSKEAETIRVIRNHLMKFGRTPSVRNIQDELGYKSPRSVSLILERLIQLGIILKDNEGRIRLAKFEIYDEGNENARTINIPLVGTVACGSPIFAEENIEAEIPVSTKLIDTANKYFLLKAQGDSMNLSGINDSDLVLIKQQFTAENGNEVVALIDDEATIKVFQRKDDIIVLKPNSTNKIHQPIILTSDFRIQGIVVTVIPY